MDILYFVWEQVLIQILSYTKPETIKFQSQDRPTYVKNQCTLLNTQDNSHQQLSSITRTPYNKHIRHSLHQLSTD